MKTKINRKTYDTEAAIALAVYTNDLPVGNIYRFTEVLYIKPDGEYFLYGHGGAMSPYAKRYANRCNASGEAIVPMSVDQAKAWVKQWGTILPYREIFGTDAE